MAEKTEAKTGGEEGARPKRPFETVKALGLAVLLALAIRSFVVEPFKIPSGSMIPTLLVGDYILVNKFAFGVRVPITGKLLIPLGEPERGDVVVFRYPDDESIDYIKRIIGMPGDKVEIRDGRLWVNEEPVDRLARGEFSFHDYRKKTNVVKRAYTEINASGAEYSVIRNRNPMGVAYSRSWTVPENRYFMMGDNRDDSRDSRLWNNKFVSPEQIKGRAFRVHWSWVVEGATVQDRGFIVDLLNTVWRVATLQVEKIRWTRIGRRVDGPADLNGDHP